jgi:hypothetical protein
VVLLVLAQSLSDEGGGCTCGAAGAWLPHTSYSGLEVLKALAADPACLWWSGSGLITHCSCCLVVRLQIFLHHLSDALSD